MELRKNKMYVKLIVVINGRFVIKTIICDGFNGVVPFTVTASNKINLLS
jgi:hypothetical protein